MTPFPLSPRFRAPLVVCRYYNCRPHYNRQVSFCHVVIVKPQLLYHYLTSSLLVYPFASLEELFKINKLTNKLIYIK